MAIVSDQLGDMFVRIRNGQSAFKTFVVTPASSMRERVLDVLLKEGYIGGFETYDTRKGVRETRIDLRYHNRKPVIADIKRVSKPGRRVYASAEGLPRFYNGLGIAILSTSSGVITDHDARQKNVGGEVLCMVF